MASSSSSSCNWECDVFPSFSGTDVRITFLSHLIRELDRKLIIVFKDNETERSRSLGPELKLAVRTSRIAVVVFSKNYASSSWCLNELLEIVKCKQEFGQIVIPIFYRLDPSHVRHQTGYFGKMFKKTCCNKTERVKIRWRKALTDVANILGYHSVTWDNEAKMIEEIVNNVFGKLLLTSSKDSEDFVGIENHIAKMILLLDFKCKQGRMVGICGSSGIGKTTIARVLFNRISRHFQGSVFVDRAFVSKSMGIYSRANPDDYNMKLHLQGNFLSEVLGIKDMKVFHLGAVGERLKNHNVLIFIDDLEDQVVLDTLVGHTHWFGRGSRIVVITKHMHLLRSHGIDHIYEVHLPSDGLALQMLCRSAFKQNYPPDGFMKLASESAVRAGNLPLALKVLGSYLRGRDKKEWMDMLLMFRNGQYGKIEEILKFCYNGLNNKNDEAIFRHIAFFNREKISDIKLLLADSELDVDNGLKNLAEKSLIHEKCNTVEMHSLVQEMGEDIIRTQSNEPGEREFLVDSKDICDVLQDITGTEKVLGMSLDMDETNGLHISEHAFQGLDNLQFLSLFTKKGDLGKESSLHLLERLDHFPRKLRLLHWELYPSTGMPREFHPEHLVKLQMQRSKVEKLWEGVHSLSALKEMDMWGSENLKEIPDLSMATNLETLNLGACSSLVELPSSVRYLNKLEMLDMSFCKNLEIIPANINLQSLSHLNLSGCSRLRGFPSLSTNISSLSLDQTGIEEVPGWIENFTQLRLISMRGCEKLCPSVKSSLPNDSIPRVELNFINCINLDQEALLQKLSVFKRLALSVLSGEEVPSYFTQRTTGTSLTNIPLLQTTLSQPFFRFMACAAVDSGSISISHFSFVIEVSCRFIDILGNHFGSAYWPLYLSTAPLGSHLVIFNCRLPLNEDNAYLAKRDYDHVDIQFHLMGDCSEFKLKGCGIRLCEDYTPSPDIAAHRQMKSTVDKKRRQMKSTETVQVKVKCGKTERPKKQIERM
ncbi:hypothetical protein AALP_AA7G168400 [Arabis alpina]|uniref:ADP-ribosyl cyclase/cyclic ADP-ribose hydrolase n=1 Tax=Arabis alpina TaxID=50452 RepID=A0A087GIK4_ARAAL|nr:hypothetical protein AALP_AA7G168400 [Arabis alpina]